MAVKSLESTSCHGIAAAIFRGTLLALVLSGATLNADDDPSSRYLPSKLLTKLAIPALHESSGLAPSRLREGLLWSHNDSGDSARLFAFDLAGTLVATVNIQGATNQDWEDMASYVQDGKSYFLIGDTGDNQRRRKNCVLYRVPERPPESGTMTVDQTVRFRFETGPADCEAIAFDTSRNEVILIDKGWDLACGVFVLPWPKTSNNDKIFVAKHIVTLPIAGVTAVDIDTAGQRAIVATYGSAYEYCRGPNEDWNAAFRRKGYEVPLPARRQGESICYAADGQSIFLTSEFAPSPLFQLMARPETTPHAD